MSRLHELSGAAFIGAAVAALIVSSTGVAHAEGVFSSFAGNWKGVGTIVADSGQRESLRCRAHYDVGGGGSTLSQNLTCASDSYKFNVVSNVTASSGSLSGTWAETSRGAQGRISGSIGPTQISAFVQGVGFTASIGIAARGGRQSVTISPTGADIKNVTVTMSKS